MTDVLVPSSTIPVSGDDLPTVPYYQFFEDVSHALTLVADEDNLKELDVRVTALENEDTEQVPIKGQMSIAVAPPNLISGAYTVSLKHDSQYPGNTTFYGTSATGDKGWHPAVDLFDDSVNVTVAADASTGVLKADLTDVATTTGGALKKYGFDTKGRLSQSDDATTTDLTEGTNLYFTEDRAQTAVVVSSITNGDTTHAPSGDAVFEALAGKEPAISAGTTAQYWRGDKSWSDFASDVRATVLTGLSTATNAAIAATDTVLQAFGKLQAQITDNLLPKGYIDGLQMQWVGPNAVTVTSGACYIEGASKVVANAADMPLTGLALGASSWGHLYAYVSGGVLAIEASTVAPASPYNGTARSKTGDTSRRYIGSIRTNTSGSIINFLMSGSRIVYRDDVANGFAPSSDGFRVLNSGTSTTDVIISCSELVPTTSRLANLRLQNTSTAGGFRVKQSDGTYVAAGAAGETVSPGGLGIFDFPLNASQQLIYFFSSTPSGGGFIDVAGYVFER